MAVAMPSGAKVRAVALTYPVSCSLSNRKLLMEKILENTKGTEQLNFDQIIPRVRSFLDTHKDKVISVNTGLGSAQDSKSKVGLSATSKRQPTIVMSQDTAVELGHPSTASANLVLWTYAVEKINAGMVHLLGKDLPEVRSLPQTKTGRPQAKALPQAVDFAQIVMLQFEQGAQGDAPHHADPFLLESTQYLSNRLPGYMVRMVPNRLWARISHEAIENGLNFAALGKALISAYTQKFEFVKAVEVVFITSGKEDVEKFQILSAQSKVISSQNKKLELVGDGEYECIDLDCNHCDEQPVCDEIRDMITIRKKT